MTLKQSSTQNASRFSTLRFVTESRGQALHSHRCELLPADQLAKLGDDIIETRFPLASDGNSQAVKDIAEDIGNRENPPIILGLARALEKDMTRCYEAVRYAASPRIHTSIATSDVHMAQKLKKSHEEVLEITTKMVTYACSQYQDVEFELKPRSRLRTRFAQTLTFRKNVRGADDVTILVHGRHAEESCGPTTNSGTMRRSLCPTIALKRVDEGREITATSTGTGSVDAAFTAINSVMDDMVSVTLIEYKVSSVAKGIEALDEVACRLMELREGSTQGILRVLMW